MSANSGIKACVLGLVCLFGVQTALGQTLFREGEGVYLGTTMGDTPTTAISGLNLTFRPVSRLDFGVTAGYHRTDFAMGVGLGYTFLLPRQIGVRPVASVMLPLEEPFLDRLAPHAGAGLTLFRQTRLHKKVDSYPGVALALQTDFGHNVFRERLTRVQMPSFISLGSSVQLMVNPFYDFENRFGYWEGGFGIGLGLRLFSDRL